MQKIDIDVICPLYNASNQIENLITHLKEQKGVNLNKVIFPITKSDDSKNTGEYLASLGYTYFEVDRENFSHSLTREKAMNEYAQSQVVLMMSQDITFLDEFSVYNLVKEINERVVYAYGRQVAKNRTIEGYIRESNYGNEDLLIENSDIEKLQLKAFFASDAFSAYYRPVFIQLNGYDNKQMMMNEDMYYSRKVLLAGYQKKYVANARVMHYHNLKLKQLYNRYYQTGKWFSQNPEFNEYKSTSSGRKLAFSVLKKALKQFNIPVLIKFIPNMMARVLGMRKGKKKGL